MESALWNLLEIIINYFQGFLYTYFIYSFLSPKKERNAGRGFLLCLTAIGTVQTTFDYYLPEKQLAIVLCHTSIMSLYAIQRLKGSIGKKIFACALPILLNVLIAMAVLPLHTYLYQGALHSAPAANDNTIRTIMMTPNTLRFIALASVQILFFLSIKLILHFRQLLSGDKQKNNIYILEWVIGLSTSVVLLLFMYLIQITLEKTYDRMARQQLNFIIGLVFLVFLLIFVMLFLLGKFYRHQLEINTIEQDKLYIKHELELIRQSQLKIDCLRHDMKNHLLQIEILAKEGNTKEILQYAASGRKSLIMNKQYVSTGNKNLDCMLNFKLDIAKNEGIAFTTHMALPKDLHIASFDLNSLLGNLLDNALEAIRKTSEKKLDISIQYNKNMLIIKIGNSFNGKILRNFRTTKTNPAKHGLGLKSVQMVVKKYNGSIQYDYKQEYFVTKVLLYDE